MTFNCAWPGVGIGIAYGAYVPRFLSAYPNDIDYVEIPYEQLRHDASVECVGRSKPIVLHCASMSMASATRPSSMTVDDIYSWITRTGTPWLGEHLSFITADRHLAGPVAEEYAPGEPFNIGYTVSPPMNDSTVDTLLESIAQCEEFFGLPLLLENPPLYFRSPGTNMSQAEFITAICCGSRVNILLDLTHFYISSQTGGFDPNSELLKLPLDRVIETHVSGVDYQAGMHWDNHATRAPSKIFDLLEVVAAKSPLRAVTLEYNWSAHFPQSVLLDEIVRVKGALARVGARGRE